MGVDGEKKSDGGEELLSSISTMKTMPLKRASLVPKKASLPAFHSSRQWLFVRRIKKGSAGRDLRPGSPLTQDHSPWFKTCQERCYGLLALSISRFTEWPAQHDPRHTTFRSGPTCWRGCASSTYHVFLGGQLAFN
jgi:hypothetical protein